MPFIKMLSSRVVCRPHTTLFWVEEKAAEAAVRKIIRPAQKITQACIEIFNDIVEKSKNG